MNLSEKYQLAYQFIRTARRLLLVGHTDPDADALAAIAAVLETLVPFGAEAYAFADKKPTDVFSFIPHEERVNVTPPSDLRDFDVILILDCGSIKRTALAERLEKLLTLPAESRPFIIDFDHHQPNKSYADLEIRLPDKASTTEIIYEFLKINGVEINKTAAECILIGLMTDTGHFLYPNSSRAVLKIASEMLLKGASLVKVISPTVHNKSFGALKLWGRVLEDTQLNPDTGLAVVVLKEKDLATEKVEGEEDAASLGGELASFLASLNGVKVALVLREEEGQVKGSLRTNDKALDVIKIAQIFGGGGHKKAAGFSLPGRLEKTPTGWKVARSL